MKRCVFLTMEDPTGFVIDDQLAYEPLQDLDWHVEAIPWTTPDVAWRDYDAVVIRSTWDYTESPERFLAVLADIEQTGVPLLNSARIVRWNLQKTYLRELAERDVPIVPTVWRERLEPGELSDLLAEIGADEAVVKPVVGAGARGAFRLDRRAITRKQCGELETYYAARPLMAQPFLPTIVSEGEYSLFYFGGEYSHAIVKRPKSGDYRVQEEHGGLIRAVTPEPGLLAAAEKTLHALGESLLYARVDCVRSPSGDGFWLMELELIEPALYFRMDEASPRRFARALDAHVGRASGPSP